MNTHYTEPHYIEARLLSQVDDNQFTYICCFECHLLTSYICLSQTDYLSWNEWRLRVNVSSEALKTTCVSSNIGNPIRLPVQNFGTASAQPS